MSWYKGLTRREFIRLGTAAAAATATISCSNPKLVPWRFLTVEEARTLAALCDQLIPPDTEPGADWARVVNFIDVQLCGPYLPLRQSYRRGLASLERSSQSQFSKTFSALPAERQVLLLHAMERNELPSDAWREISPSAFFELLLGHTRQGFYGDPRHGGNRDRVSWKMVGLTYPPVRGRQHYDPKNS